MVKQDYDYNREEYDYNREEYCGPFSGLELTDEKWIFVTEVQKTDKRL